MFDAIKTNKNKYLPNIYVSIGIFIVFGIILSYSIGWRNVEAQSSKPDDFNAGIVRGAWLSQLPVFTDDNFQVKTAFQNNSGFDIVGSVTFFDNDDEIDNKSFDVKNGKLIEISTDITGDRGTHQYSIEIDVYKKVNDGNDTETEGDLLFNQTANTFEIFIDDDTDGDNIGNIDDEDDDNDGVIDTEDEDPLNPPPDPTEEVIEKVKENATNVFEKVNNFTDNVHTSIQEKTETLRDEIKELDDRTEEINTARSGVTSGSELTILTSDQKSELDEIKKIKNIKKGQLALLNFGSFMSANTWFFWIGIIIISYFIFLFLRKMVRKLFRNSYE